MNTSTHPSLPPSSSRMLVHDLLAAQLQVHPAFIQDAQTIDELLLDPLDLVLVALRLEDIERNSGEFPLAGLEHTTTVAELVALVDRWREGDVSVGSPFKQWQNP